MAGTRRMDAPIHDVGYKHLSPETSASMPPVYVFKNTIFTNMAYYTNIIYYEY